MGRTGSSAQIEGLNRALQEVIAERDRLKAAWQLQQTLLTKQNDERERVRDRIIALRQYIATRDGSRAEVLGRLDAILGRISHGG